MKASIVAIGDELLSGKVKDENISFVTKYLYLVGVDVIRAYIVGDDEREIKDVLKDSAEKSDFVIVSGGLGPTTDDRTREAVASLLNVKLKFSRKLWNLIKRRFEERGMVVPETNKKQATFPDKCRIIENPLGTAPGFTVKFKGARLFFLPGVPREFREMFLRSVLPLITGEDMPIIRTLRVFGLPESEIAFRLKDLEFKYSFVKFSYLPIFPENLVLLSSSIKNHIVLNDAVNEVKERLGDYLYSEGETMEETVGNLLKKLNLKLSVAESCTGGLISSMITNVPGSSAYFAGGIVTYSYFAKEKFLDIDIEFLKKNGAVNEFVARRMAESVREKFNADIGISTTGILGPSRGGESEEVGTLYTALAHRRGCSVNRFYFPLGDRKAKKVIFATYALDKLRRFLLIEEKLKKYRKLIEEAENVGISFLKKPPSSKKLLVFSITANPPTIAHSFVLKEVMNKFSLRSALILLDIFHADKTSKETSVEERIEMARIAFSDIEGAGIGITREGLYVNKLRVLMNLWRKRKIVFLVGADNIFRILDPSFYREPDKDLEFLFSNAGFIIMTRCDVTRERIWEELRKRGYEKKEIEVVETPDSMKWISSSDVRKKIKDGLEVSDALDYRVKNFIDERGLYR